MGFDNSDLKFLLSGMSGQSVCTLGRQNLFLSQSELSRTLAEFERPALSLPNRAIYYAEDVLRPLGFSVDSVDASNYESATIIHDLNNPIPDGLVERFDIVWDGGTLEHVFNFPTALVNAMRMVKIGGHLALRTPANNQCGHGFYQFSPELFYRIFTSQNGFEIVRLYISSKGKYFHVRDPAEAHCRVELLDKDAAMLMVDARKTSRVPENISAPQQSDYVDLWRKGPQADGRLKSFFRGRLSPETITTISRVLNELRQRQAVLKWRRRSKLSNPAFYSPVRQWNQPTRDVWGK